MTPMPDLEAWERLGHALRAQRAELDPRYRTFDLFVRERGTPRDLNYRMLWDIEHGRRDNYRGPALRAIEGAYGLPPKWIDRFLADARQAVRPKGWRFPDNPEMDRRAAEIWQFGRNDPGSTVDDGLRWSYVVLAAEHLGYDMTARSEDRDSAAS